MKNAIARFILCALVLGTSQTAMAAIDSNAAVVQLRKICVENGTALNNCFTSLNTLNTWIWGTRLPSAVNPLHVRIGTGTFPGQFTCAAVPEGQIPRGHVTLTGSGISNTTIDGAALSPIVTTQCVNLTFESMSIDGAGAINIGGSTVWNNVELHGKGYAWSDGLVNPETCTGTHKPGTHYWYNSRIVATVGINNAAVAYYNNCDSSWFYGSELTSKPATHGQFARGITAYGGDVHVYGGSIRVTPEPGVQMSGFDLFEGLSAVEAQSLFIADPNRAPHVHIHGTGIDVITDQAADVVALTVVAGMVHANASAYNLHTHGGSVIRIHTPYPTGQEEVMAPYLWEPSATPPAIESETGSDMVVVPGSSGHPRLLIYDGSCGTSHWFDPNAQTCYP